MKTEQAAFAKRIREALEKAGLDPSPKRLAQLFALHGGTPVTSQAISGWLSGKHLPKQANMRALAKLVGMQPHELQYGQRFVGVSESRARWPSDVSGTDRLTIEGFLRLPPKQRGLVGEIVMAFTNAAEK